MIPLNALVIYKAKPAIVRELLGDKYNIALADGALLKVRDKDIELLHSGPVKNFDGFNEAENLAACYASGKVQEARELFSGEENEKPEFAELASLIFGGFTPASAYAVYRVLQDGLYFYGTITDIKLRAKNEIETEEAKRGEKTREGEERAGFLERCKKGQLTKEDIAQASRFLQDAEALAYGKSAKSKTLKELKIEETPEAAHEFLLKSGIWTRMVNPHPARFGVSLNSASAGVGAPPSSMQGEERRDLTRLEAYAIDSEWSDDPDDAVSIETSGEDSILYIHVADPASVIKPDSPADKDARNRGATLYLPETIARMIAPECLPLFALGLSETSCALTIKMTINKNGEVINTEIFPSTVKVKRLTYQEADNLLDNNETLRALNELAARTRKRRLDNGAAEIDLPDVHITIENETVNIKPYEQNKSQYIVKECMIAAGEGAGTWASEKGLAFPYISQEAELPDKVLPGYAGAIQLRKSMRPRVISVKPGRHQGMGLEIYSQVTSPLRRYTDLLAHMQIRAFLRGEAPLAKDEISARIGYCEAGAIACARTERASDLHWKMVYLQDKKDSEWRGFALEKKGNLWHILIPALALETHAALNKDAAPNDEVKLILKSANIPYGEAVFIQA